MKTQSIQGKIKIIPSFPLLNDPFAFAAWWHKCQVQLGIQPERLAEGLEQLGTPIALVRASQVLTRDPAQASKAARLAGRALNSAEHDVRLLARLRLATLEVMLGYRVGTNDVRGAFSALPVLHELLESCIYNR